MGSSVGGVILDESVLVSDHTPSSASDNLLRGGRTFLVLNVLTGYENDQSGLRWRIFSIECDLQSAGGVLRRRASDDQAISYPPSLPLHQQSSLQQLATQYSLHCFPSRHPDPSAFLADVTRTWGHIAVSVLFLVSTENHRANLETFNQLSNFGWVITVLDVDGGGASKDSSTFSINTIEELPLAICRLNKKSAAHKVATVGYLMKPSRQEDFAKRGAFPLCPTPNGLIFFPLTFQLPLQSQLSHVDIILHKATDEILSVQLSDPSESLNRITYTTGMHELQRYMERHANCVVVDPLDKIYPVVDRLSIQQILLGLEDLNTKCHRNIRGPHFLKVSDFNGPELVQRLSEAKLSLPSIVKPQVACGVADAHSMAIVFRVDDFKDLTVPLPAVVQEYVDHSSTLCKIYVLGGKVFYAVKKSTPNAEILVKASEGNGLRPLIFDSLKSLPTGDVDSSKVNSHSFDLELVTVAANWLARKLHLTIFGFDVVIQEGSGDHVIVDVNYLPSFKEVPDDVAIPAFWDAIRHKFD